MRPRVILVYEQFYRDYSGLIKVKKILDEERIFSRIVPSTLMVQYCILFRPHVVVIGNPDLYHGEFASLVSDKAVILSIPTEQTIFSTTLFAERVIGGHNRNNKNYDPPNIQVVEKFFLWTDFHKDSLIQAGVEENKIVVAGNPRLTIGTSVNTESSCIGIPLETEIGSSIAYDLWAFDGLDTAYGPFVEYYALSLEILNQQLKVIKLLQTLPCKIIVRPRLSDMNTDYSFLGQDIEIDKSPNVNYLLSTCEYIITGQSTIGLEAYVYGAKVISVLGMVRDCLINDSMREYISFQHPVQPKSLEELLKILKNDELYKRSTEFENQIKRYLGVDKKDAERKIAEEIVGIIEKYPSIPRRVIDPERKAELAKKYGRKFALMIRHKGDLLGVIFAGLFIVKQKIREILSGIKQ